MNPLDSTVSKKALQLLGEILEEEKVWPAHLVAIGGAALLHHGLIQRATFDVDIIAQREIDGLEPAHPLSDEIKKAAARVAEFYDLERNWLNANTSLCGLPLSEFPNELWSDCDEVSFGTQLTISYVGRTGLIFLKLHAAIDRYEQKFDIDDLEALGPDRKEFERAKDWLTSLDLISPAHTNRLENIAGKVIKS